MSVKASYTVVRGRYLHGRTQQWTKLISPLSIRILDPQSGLLQTHAWHVTGERLAHNPTAATGRPTLQRWHCGNVNEF
jgi:hypothetical protein